MFLVDGSVIMKKLYMIGMDSVPLWILEELKNEKGMEIFSKMLGEKSLVDMESTLPPMTGPAWPSIYTGLGPGKHGVPDFFVMKDDYTPDIVYYDSNGVPPFWKSLAQSGIQCLVITPATVIQLPDYNNIDMITGFPLPSRTNSRELEKLMKKHRFAGEPDIEMDIKSGKMTEKEAVGHFITSIKSRIAIAKDMMSKKDYGFVYVCFTETDRLQHFVTGKKNWREYLLPIYREIASFVNYASTLADKEGSALIVVSDHGAQPIKSKFLINSWLTSKGYVKLKDSFAKSVVKKEKQGASYNFREMLLKTKLRRIYDKMPHPVKKAAFRALGSAFSSGAGGNYVRMHLFDFDMKETSAFAAIANEPVSSIWINDDRFSSGSVGKTQRNKLMQKLILDLKSIRSLEGDKLIVNIFDGKTYYGGTGKFIAPDLFVEAKKGYTIDLFYYSSISNFMDPEGAKSGDHIRKGIFGYYPASLRIKTQEMSVLDVAPTILNYFGKKANMQREVKKKL